MDLAWGLGRGLSRTTLPPFRLSRIYPDARDSELAPGYTAVTVDECDERRDVFWSQPGVRHSVAVRWRLYRRIGQIPCEIVRWKAAVRQVRSGVGDFTDNRHLAVGMARDATSRREHAPAAFRFAEWLDPQCFEVLFDSSSMNALARMTTRPRPVA